MKCPTCPDSTLLMSDRQGVEIDYCPTCRGVWLDRGELDKLIQLSVNQQMPVEPVRASAPPSTGYPAGRRDFDDSDFGKHQRSGYRRKSWLSDIFD